MKLFFVFLFLTLLSSCKKEATNSWYASDFGLDEYMLPEGNYNTTKYKVTYLVDGDTLTGILDTGSDITTFKPKETKKYEKTFDGDLKLIDGSVVEMKYYQVHSIMWGRAEVRNKYLHPKVKEPEYSDNHILGRDLFGGGVLQIDHYDNCLRLATDTSIMKIKGVPVDCRFDDRGRVYLLAEINGKELELLIDTGNSCDIELNQSNFFAQSFEDVIETKVLEIDGVQVFFNALGDVKIGAKIFKNCRISNEGNPNNMVGVGFLRRFKSITIDYLHQKLYMELPPDCIVSDDISCIFSSDTITVEPLEWMNYYLHVFDSYDFSMVPNGDFYRVKSLSWRNTEDNRDALALGDTVVGIDNLLFSEEYKDLVNSVDNMMYFSDARERGSYIHDALWLKNDVVLHLLKSGELISHTFSRRKFLEEPPCTG